MDVDDAVADLYALPPDEFVAARNELAKRAKSEASAHAAARIKALRKPNLAAWVANQLARERRSDVGELVSLGEQMRSATAEQDGRRLRELTLRRKELVDTLLAQATELAGAAQQRLSDDTVEALNETLLAAVADPGAADDLQAGQLTRGLQHVGFGPVADTGPAEVISLTAARTAREQRGGVVAPGQRQPAGAPSSGQLDDEAREGVHGETAEHELEQAESAVTAAEDHVDDLEADLDERRQRLASAEAAVERLTAELADARQQAEQADADVEAGEQEAEQARADAEQARRRRREAKRRLATSS